MFRWHIPMLAVILLSACTESNKEKDPWAQSNEYRQERTRTDAQADELRNPLSPIHTGLLATAVLVFSAAFIFITYGGAT